MVLESVNSYTRVQCLATENRPFRVCASVRCGGFSELISIEAVRVTLSRESAMRGEVDCNQKLSKVNDKI